MAIKPRFARAAAADRTFVDREVPTAAFLDELEAIGSGPRVLSINGVGGIGKSRLLRELRERASGSLGCLTAAVDLQVPAMRQQEAALAVLRTELGRQGVGFDRFDIAYAVLWQRLHPNSPLSARDLPFVQESEVLSSVLDLSPIPVFGTALGLVKLADRAAVRRRERRTMRTDSVLQSLDDLGNAEVFDAVTYLFAEDVRAAAPIPQAFFIDAYEALVPTPLRAGTGSEKDAWLRDLIAQLDHALVVVASREPLGWHVYDQEWKQIIRACPLPGLPEDARATLLEEAGINTGPEQAAISAASQGLPFYLHLAIDTRSPRSENATEIVSAEEILQRFLHHVPTGEIRLLEPLSLARAFDYEIFRALGDAFDLPADRLTWESLTAYSFVLPAGDNLRLHQLMSVAMQTRLSPEAQRDAHALLHELWQRRSSNRDLTEVAAIRETVYHGVRADRLDPNEVLEHADRSVRRGGIHAAEAIVSDLRSLESLEDDAPLLLVTRCLEAETAIMMGDAGAGLAAARSAPAPPLGVEAGARLAMAIAHAHRIAGDTNRAGELYSAIWDEHEGPVRFSSVLWVADIHMWQGRFVTAYGLCQEALGSSDLGDARLRGDIHRLIHLGHRFELEFAESLAELERATSCYSDAEDVFGMANVSTNRAELLAWTEPAAAIQVAAEALETQQALSALHEIGKTYTAIATASLLLGQYDSAAENLDLACEHLERAHYRSGRARAEFFRAVLFGRLGDVVPARSSMERAVREFVAAAVYPTMIIGAERFLARLDCPSPIVSAAATQARLDLELDGGPAAFLARVERLIDTFLGPQP